MMECVCNPHTKFTKIVIEKDPTDNQMFSGEETGVKDRNGAEIHCGDTVELTEVRKAYYLKTREDHHGIDHLLPQDQWELIPEARKVSIGIIKYNSDFCNFVIKFDEYLLESGNLSEDLNCMVAPKLRVLSK